MDARLRRRLSRVLAAALCGAASAAAHADDRASFTARCEDATRASRVALVTHDAGYRIDNSLSYRTLTRMKQPGVRHGWVLGLTHTESQVTVQMAGVLLQDPAADVECVAPRVTIDLRYPPIVIYIGSEFAPNTCAYGELLAHERRHLAAYLDFLPRVEQQLRERFATRFDGQPVYARRGQAQALLRREIDSRWLPYVKGAMAQVEIEQARIDSAQEYARLSKVCQGEVQSLIGSTRRSHS